jgi:hypothetical protein
MPRLMLKESLTEPVFDWFWKWCLIAKLSQLMGNCAVVMRPKIRSEFVDFWGTQKAPRDSLLAPFWGHA